MRCRPKQFFPCRKHKVSDLDKLTSVLLANCVHQRRQFIFFILFTVYGLLTTLGVTDRQLFLEEGIKMPLINITLPLIPFFIVIPFFLIALHFNLLYHYQQFAIELLDIQHNYHDFFKGMPLGLFDATILYPKRQFSKILRFFLVLCLYFLPFITLVIIWLRFSDYQERWSSTWQLIVIIIDAFIILLFADIFKDQKIYIRKKLIERISIVLIAISVALCCVYHYKIIWPLTSPKIFDSISFSNSLMYPLIRNYEWLFPRITLPGHVLIEPHPGVTNLLKQLDKDYYSTPENLYLPRKNFRNRFLRFVDLSKTVLIRGDFAKSRMENANFSFAQLHEADFRKTNLQKANFMRAILQGVNFHSANLQETNFRIAELQGTTFENVSAENAKFWGAELQGSWFLFANLRNANFQGANLQGSTFNRAKLAGASFWKANLQGVYLGGAELQWVDFQGARLQGAFFAGRVNINKSFWLKNKFFYRIGKTTEFISMDQELIDGQEANQIITLLRKDMENAVNRSYIKHCQSRIAEIKQSFGKSIGAWIQNQEKVNVGELTIEMAEITNKQVKDITARGRMRISKGLPKRVKGVR